MELDSVVGSWDELLALYEDTGTEPPGWLLAKLGRLPEVTDADELARLAREAGVPERYAWAVPDASRVSRMREGTGYYLHGGAGDGKTTLAASMLKGWLAAGCGTALWASSVALLSEVSDTYGGHGSEVAVMRRYTGCGLLVVDDLGKERMGEWALSKLFWLFDERYSARRPTIVTTQYGTARLAGLMAEAGSAETAQAIVGRIRETFRAIDCGPDDRRLG